MLCAPWLPPLIPLLSMLVWLWRWAMGGVRSAHRRRHRPPLTLLPPPTHRLRQVARALLQRLTCSVLLRLL